MVLFDWLILVLVLGGAALVWMILRDRKDGNVTCRGCGQCALTGECVLMKKPKKASEKGKDPS